MVILHFCNLSQRCSISWGQARRVLLHQICSSTVCWSPLESTVYSITGHFWLLLTSYFDFTLCCVLPWKSVYLALLSGIFSTIPHLWLSFWLYLLTLTHTKKTIWVGNSRFLLWTFLTAHFLIFKCILYVVVAPLFLCTKQTNKKRQRHYKPTINSKHSKCHESLTLTIDITFSLYAVTPKQPNARCCHTVSMVHFSTDRKGDIMACFLFFFFAASWCSFILNQSCD